MNFPDIEMMFIYPYPIYQTPGLITNFLQIFNNIIEQFPLVSLSLHNSILWSSVNSHQYFNISATSQAAKDVAAKQEVEGLEQLT